MTPGTEAALAQLYDVGSLELVMLDGPHRGETVEWPAEREPPPMYLFAVQSALPAAMRAEPGLPPPIARQKCDMYRYTGHIRDDGARLYEYGGRS